jgi:hypothetical protein
MLTRSGPAVTAEVRRPLPKPVDRTADEGDCAISFGLSAWFLKNGCCFRAMRLFVSAAARLTF